MPFNWTDFISCAKDLSLKSDEASWRSSISRAYYGAFGKIKIYCSGKYKVSISGESVHQKVIQRLKESDDSREYSLGNTLSLLRISRNDADYESHARITKPLVDDTIKKSESTVILLDEIINNPI
jgi:uncharacterized protein (UPF0332 family)